MIFQETDFIDLLDSNPYNLNINKNNYDKNFKINKCGPEYSSDNAGDGPFLDEILVNVQSYLNIPSAIQFRQTCHQVLRLPFPNLTEAYINFANMSDQNFSVMTDVITTHAAAQANIGQLNYDDLIYYLTNVNVIERYPTYLRIRNMYFKQKLFYLNPEVLSTLNGNNGSWTNTDDFSARTFRPRDKSTQNAYKQPNGAGVFPKIQVLPQTSQTDTLKIVDMLSQQEIIDCFQHIDETFNRYKEKGSLKQLEMLSTHSLELLLKHQSLEEAECLKNVAHQKHIMINKVMLKRIEDENLDRKKIYVTVDGMWGFYDNGFCELRRNKEGVKYLHNMATGVAYINILEVGEIIDGVISLGRGIYQEEPSIGVTHAAVSPFTHIDLPEMYIYDIKAERCWIKAYTEVIPSEIWEALIKRFPYTSKLRLELVNSINTFVAKSVIGAVGDFSWIHRIVECWLQHHRRYINDLKTDGMYYHVHVLDKDTLVYDPLMYRMVENVKDVEYGTVIRSKAVTFNHDPSYELRSDMLVKGDLGLSMLTPCFRTMNQSKPRWNRTMAFQLTGEVPFVQYDKNAYNLCVALKRVLGKRETYIISDMNGQDLTVTDEMLDLRQASWYEALMSKLDKPALEIMGVDYKPLDRKFVLDKKDAFGHKVKFKCEDVRLSTLVNGYPMSWANLQRKLQHQRLESSFDTTYKFAKMGYTEAKSAFDEMVFGYSANDIGEIREVYASQKHFKRKDRLRIFKEHADQLDQYEPINTHMLSGQLKNELAKFGKAGRIFVSYGDSVLQAPECIAPLKRAHGCIFNAKLGKRKISITINTLSERDVNIIDGKIHLDLEDIFQKITDLFKEGKDFLYALSYSDDSVLVGRLNGVSFGTDLDITSCDASNKFGVFASLAQISLFNGQTGILGELYECTKTIRFDNPDDLSEKIYVEPLTVFEGSGTKLTTCLNNQICGACLLSIIMILIIKYDEQPIAWTLIDLPVVIGESVDYGAFLCGMRMTSVMRFVGCERFQKLQFLKYSPSFIGSKLVMSRNLGALLRSLGSLDGDLSCEQVGVTKAVWKTKTLSHWLWVFARNVVMSMKHEPGNIILNALRALFEIPQHDDYIPTSELQNRYGMDVCDYEELAQKISRLECGAILSCDLLTMIFHVDYGTPLTFPYADYNPGAYGQEEMKGGDDEIITRFVDDDNNVTYLLAYPSVEGTPYQSLEIETSVYSDDILKKHFLELGFNKNLNRRKNRVDKLKGHKSLGFDIQQLRRDEFCSQEFSPSLLLSDVYVDDLTLDLSLEVTHDYEPIVESHDNYLLTGPHTFSEAYLLHKGNPEWDVLRSLYDKALVWLIR
jgi:hypothetical protein